MSDISLVGRSFVAQASDIGTRVVAYDGLPEIVERLNLDSAIEAIDLAMINQEKGADMGVWLSNYKDTLTQMREASA